ncbi:MAG: phosphoadenosine phosphosulfate reductase family protein [Deltaproteobacteria bacterium]|nr:phosphoadenosine phosphosulfate reductase family protein [Deltaproteobacteria bacterium]
MTKKVGNKPATKTADKKKPEKPVRQTAGKKFEMKIEQRLVEELVPYVRNAKDHPPRQIKKIVMSIKNYGFNIPILIDKQDEIITGHGRILAAQKLKMKSIPCIRIEHLTPEQIRAFRIADNKVAESEWNDDLLQEELEELYSLNFDLDLTGFDFKELQERLMHLFPEEDEPDEEEAAGDLYSDEDAPKEIKLPKRELKIEFYTWLKSMEKIYVMFSGGKDSMAQVAVLLDHKVPKEKMVLLHNRVPLDYPGLDKFVKDFAKQVGIKLEMIGMDYSDTQLFKVLRSHGLPKGFTSRWCTRIWKIIPMNRWLKENELTGKPDIVLCQGFRREEGSSRENAAVRAIGKDNKIRIARPILDYTEDDVFKIIKKYNWNVHPIYKYLKRLGCIYCFAVRRREWVAVRENDPEVFFRVLRFVAEASCSKNMSGDDIKYILRKILGLKTIDKQLKEDGVIPKTTKKEQKTSQK